MTNILKQKPSAKISKAITNAGWVFFDRIFRMCSGMLVGIWTARYLGPAQYGLWSYCTAFAMALLPLSRLGLANILLTKLIRDKTYEEEEILGTGFLMRTISGTLCILILFVLGRVFIKNDIITYQLILIIGSVHIFQSFEIVDIYYQYKVKSKRSVIAKSIAFFVSSATRLYFIFLGLNIISLVGTTIVEMTIGVVILLKYYYKDSNKMIFKWRFKFKLAQELILASAPIIISEFLAFVYMKIDQLMLEKYTDKIELGKYSAALKLSEVWYFIPVVITTSFLPSIASLKDSDSEKFYIQYQKLFNTLALLGLAISIVFTIIANPLTSFLYGQKYSGVGDILSIHIWTGLFLFLGVGCGNLLIIENKQNLMFLRDLFGVTTNVGLNIWLIPKYGAIGASISTLIAQIMASYLINFLIPGLRNIFNMQTNALLNILKLNKIKLIINE